MNGIIYLMIAEMLGPAVTLNVIPRYAINRTAVRAVVKVERHAENHVLIVTLDGPHYRMRRVNIDGEDGPVTQEFRWEGIGPGEYIVTAEVYDSRGRIRAAARPAELCVAGMDVSCAREEDR